MLPDHWRTDRVHHESVMGGDSGARGQQNDERVVGQQAQYCWKGLMGNVKIES
jgi:hypothetical protein